jgi:hypothetical protein
METIIKRQEFMPETGVMCAVERLEIENTYISKEVDFNEYFSKSRETVVQTIKFEYKMPLKFPNSEIMGNLCLINLDVLEKYRFKLNSVNISNYKHDKKNIHIYILYIRNKEN